MKVAIIGGGVGGLGAGYEIAKAGHQVVIFEKAPFLGGLASTFNVGGGRLERFYHHLFLSDKTIIDLLEELQLSDSLIWADSSVGFLYERQIYPLSTPIDLLRFTPVSLIDRIRMGLVTLYLQMVKNWRKFEKTTATTFMRKWAGKRNYEVIWGPLLKGKFTVYHDQVGMTWLWSKFATRVASRDKGLKEKLGYIKGSWGVLIDKLESCIKDLGGQIHTSTSVKRILTEDNCVSGLVIQQPNGEEIEEPFDVVISTIPSFALPSLVDLPEDYLAKLQSVEYEGAIAVIWVLKHSLSPIYWLNIADSDIPFLLVLEQTNLVSPSEYGGKHVVFTANYVTKDDYRWGMTADEIVREYIPHLRKINPSFDESWIEEHYLHKEPAAQPIMKVNYLQGMPSTKTPIKRLWLASMSQVYPQDRGTNYSIQLGMKVAREAMAEVCQTGLK